MEDPIKNLLSQEQISNQEVEKLTEQINQAAPRVKKLGEWPEWVGEESLAERVPKQSDTNAPGFDAGIACALDLIETDKQKLAATLHAAYTPEAVEQIRQEIKNLDPNSETSWWLTGCVICTEGGINQEQFLKQIEDFKALADDPEKRKDASQKQFNKMTSVYSLDSELGDDVPYGTIDGCIQGAYIDGHSFGVSYAESYGLYFIGTYEPSLGLENFEWSDEKDDQDRPMSGPVFHSNQYVKCSSMEELKKALEVVKSKLNKSDQ